MNSYSATNVSHTLQRHSKRLPGLLSLILCIALCVCSTYWIMQLVKPASRVLLPMPQTEVPQIDIASASGLFGDPAGLAVAASNYRLVGVVVAKNPAESVAVISANGKPPESLRIGKEIMPGASIKEVHATYVLVSEGGILKRLILPEHAQMNAGLAEVSPVRK
ncbi:type II secretion system protein N [Glaciimonas sp. PCH181]|uniref:type II secretion system protein N n=1 Tax=Glaciimonas sp. PCH181 TaxID=2133943 RepID=UPI001374DC2C|nr:type II secretion system protein N [Glaciimonas sp. PCH181]